MERHGTILNRHTAALLVIDMQQRFAPVVPEFDSIEKNIIKMAQGCRVLGVPILLTEQYPKGLGRTSEKLMAEIGDVIPFEKMRFSAAGEKTLLSELKEKAISQLILTGIETHVCMLQTGLDFLHLGYKVHLLRDATSSRLTANRDVALERLARAGVILSCVESALFELTEISGTDEFKQISKIVR